MTYNVQIKLPEGWKVSYDTLIEEDGSETSYAQAEGPAGELVELYVGDAPDDSDASDQAASSSSDATARIWNVWRECASL